MPPVPRQSARTRALLQRRRDEARRVATSFQAKVSAFEDEMRAINFSVCSDCQRQVSRAQVVQEKCQRCRRTPNVLFCSANEMELGDIPPELTDLSLTEQVLIARVHPVVSLFKIRGQQTAYSGHVMNFVQYNEQIATRLPHAPELLQTIVLLNRNTPSGIVHFRVRARKVLDALRWLKLNNQYYSDIEIDPVIVSSLPDDGDIVHLLPSIPPGEAIDDSSNSQDNIIESSCFPNFPAIDQRSVILQNLERIGSAPNPTLDLGNWPDVTQRPSNEFTSEGLICKAFPALFPYGKGDLRAPRIKTITNHNYFKYLMQYKDGRFSKDIRFPYYAYNTLARWDALNCGNVYVRLNNMEGLTAEDIRAMANDRNRDIASSIMYYGSHIRGTRPYWKQRCSELIQMVRQLGTPSVFFTLSAADYHWPDLFRIISPDIAAGQLTEQQRRNYMHENPYTVAWFFNQRCEIFMKKFMTKFFPVQDFWWRFEWQHRGSPHIHGLLWMEGAPDCSNINSLDETSKSQIINYFDTLVSAWIDSRQVLLLKCVSGLKLV